jgi:hypothetical protein
VQVEAGQQQALPLTSPAYCDHPLGLKAQEGSLLALWMDEPERRGYRGRSGLT